MKDLFNEFVSTFVFILGIIVILAIIIIPIAFLTKDMDFKVQVTPQSVQVQTIVLTNEQYVQWHKAAKGTK